MTNNETVFWGLHVRGEAGDELYIKKEFVAIGWPKAGDLRKLSPDREAFKHRVNERYPNEKPGWVINSASQLFRFVHEMKREDHVIYRSKFDHQIHIGKITGEYTHNPELSSEYPHMRPVKWLTALPVTQFSQGALYELGSALTLFQVKNYADAYRSALTGEGASAPEASDETVELVAEEIEQTTRDFVLKQLAQELKGYGFQAFVAGLLNTMGYRTQESAKGVDEGIDIIAHRDELKLEPPIIKVQVKSTEGSVGGPDVRT